MLFCLYKVSLTVLVLGTQSETVCRDGKCSKQGRKNSAIWMGVGAFLFLLFRLAVLGLGSWNRGKLRQKYNLPGSNRTDCLLWCFCAECALCQETRTLMANGVENGVWNGPDAVLMPWSAVK